MAALKKLNTAIPTDDLLAELDQIQVLGGTGSDPVTPNYGCNTVAGCNGQTYVYCDCTVYSNDSCCGSVSVPCDECKCGSGCGCPDDNENSDGGICCCGDGCKCKEKGKGNGQTGFLGQPGWM